MAQLWYDDDEVRKFHPIVEESLNQILQDEGLSGEFAVEHHPTVPGSTKTPDFSIYKIRSRRIVFILEVKRTKSDVDSQRYWNQTRGYVRDLTQDWEPGHKYFAITNIEKTVSFAERNGSDANCVLAGNPLSAGNFVPDTHDATEAIQNFKTHIQPLITDALRNTSPAWADAWQPIISAFKNNLSSAIDKLEEQSSPEIASEKATYEFLRLFLYTFISSYYVYTRSDNSRYFRANNISPDARLSFSSSRNNYARVLELDFKQIFSESPNVETRITEQEFTEILPYYNSLLETLQHYMNDAIRQNHSPEYLFNLLTENLYEHAELHTEGKVMSDSELAGLLAEICIDDENISVLDPGSGDGALLGAAYDKLHEIKSQSNPAVTHNDILMHVSGIEIDPFLTQLSAFRLIMKNPNEVNDSTQAQVSTGDIFTLQAESSHDVVLMNPPYLRNEESTHSLVGSSLGQMITAIRRVGEEPFVEDASQPNLYFYFLNYANHYLKADGKMGVILMSKFMNNQDAVFLKSHIKDRLVAVISYPKSYFSEFRVTTSIVIINKTPNDKPVKFLNLRTDNLISNPPEIKEILGQDLTTITPEYTLRVVQKNQLNPEDNWRAYLLDPEDKYDKIRNVPGASPLSSLFELIKRGSAANSGAADVVFPRATSKLPLAREVPNELLCFGMNRNKGYTKFALGESELCLQQAINFPKPFNESNPTGYDETIGNPFLEQLYEAASREYTKWKKILNESYASKVDAQIIIPRADRTKHSVYCNVTGEKLVLSTNFFGLSRLRTNTAEINADDQIKFITAYLLSSFGQIQFELLANDQEGLRKLEGNMIEKLTVIDPTKVSKPGINAVVSAFNDLNDAESAFSGLEGATTPRKSLDLAISNVLMELGMQDFETPEKLAMFSELFLADLVEARAS